MRRAGARPAGEALIGGAPSLTVTVGGLFAYAEALQIFTFVPFHNLFILRCVWEIKHREDPAKLPGTI